MPLGRGLILYVSSILLMPTVKYLAISMSVFLTYFLLVGQKGGMVFISDFKKMEKVYFMAHPSGWDIKYTFSLYYSWAPRVFRSRAKRLYCYGARTSGRGPCPRAGGDLARALKLVAACTGKTLGMPSKPAAGRIRRGLMVN